MRRQFRAISAAVLVGVVIQESLWTILNLIDFSTPLNELLVSGQRPASWLIAALLAWAAGGLFAGLMATLIARSRISGLISGLLLSASACLLMVLAVDEPRGLLALAAVPLVASVPGTWLGRLALSSDALQAHPAQGNPE